ncbi:MAG: hypothetical protein EYC70_02825 [Planctomycetota bacterium]|nr:MAG: hypothetical protein EYC70_02825 [Planctomycetota bacterium]
MRRAVLFFLAALAYASGLAGLWRYGRMSLQNRWPQQGDGVLFWLQWANDPGSRRIAMAAVLALAVLAVSGWAARSGWRWLRPAAWAVRIGGHPAVAGAGVLLALAPHAVAPLVRPDASGKPSVVFILLDTLRLDYTGWGGSPFPGITPRLDALAANGAAFTQAISQASWTKPAVATMLTGLTPSRHLAVGRPNLGYYPNLPADRRTLAEAFAAAGYDTAAFSTNPNISVQFGFQQGVYTWREDTFMPAEGVARFAQDWIRGRRDPFFLYLHFNDAHYPYAAPEGYKGRYDHTGLDVPLTGETEKDFRELRREWSAQEMEHLRAAYAEEVSYLDEQVGTLVEGILQQRDDVFIVIVADHGEEFLEHGDVGHGHSLYDELLRVPLQFTWSPRLALRPGRHPQQVRTVDVTPTLLELAGLSWPAAAPGLDGQSLLPALRGEALQDRPAFAETDSAGSPRSGPTGPLRAWREPGEKLIVTDPWSAQAGRYWLFDLERDPGERRNLAVERTERVASLLEHLQRSGWLIRKDALPEVKFNLASLSEEQRHEMAELGYAEEAALPAGLIENFSPGAVPWATPNLGAAQQESGVPSAGP